MEWKDTDMFERMTDRVWRRFAVQDSGQDLLEYALLVALIVVVAVSAVTQVGTTIKTVFWDAIATATNAI
jgi:Flp pilus assembly pilin Flp